MTSKLEKQFFDTFGIDKRVEFEPCYALDSSTTYLTSIKRYPQITDSIYLMLLATLTCISSIEFPFSDIQKLKEDILKEVIKHSYGFDKHQVRVLFEEGR